MIVSNFQKSLPHEVTSDPIYTQSPRVVEHSVEIVCETKGKGFVELLHRRNRTLLKVVFDKRWEILLFFDFVPHGRWLELEAEYFVSSNRPTSPACRSTIAPVATCRY